ncbi:uncharacterized protein LOC117315989 isoform X3 [Pecten maximus]|uniref:uncharacterized protein LOC117315989 isoform X3 n=1 Tax=Pecten maximus TaxID=6579 RepID=UPI001458F36D|nr:uncharacterized protein LOC117315989 isoform X3 [Pecten maximus]
MISGNDVLGGVFLVVTDSPTKPTIITSSQSPVLDSSVTMGCISTSQSQPDNHELVLTSTWKLNGTEFKSGRFSFQGTSLVINPVRLRDKYTRYTCVTKETGHGYNGPTSVESQEFRLTPRYGPQFIKIEGTEGRSPLIREDGYGPVVCKTDCNPSCVMEWRRQGASLISPRGTTDNQLELRDSRLPRTREVTYTCKARLSTNAGFTAPTMEKKVTVEIYFPPLITMVRYLEESDTYRPVGTSDIRIAEDFSLILSLDISSHPKPNVILLNNQKTVAMGTVSDTAGIYNVELNNLQCNHTGRYGVRATNFVTQNRSNVNSDVRQLGLQVSCTPRRLGSANNVIGLAGRKDQTIPLNVTVIANPVPTGQWSDGVRTLPVLQNNNYTYTVRGNVQVRSVNDYRKYHVNITNGIQGALTVTFQIHPEVPDIPVDFRSSEVGYDYVKVMWTSGFNGGTSQLFHVDVMSVGDEWITDMLNISDKGQGVLMTHTLVGLTPSTYYIIRLNISNKVGRGNSTEISIRTRTIEPPTHVNLTVLILAVSVTLLLFVTGILGGVVTWQRRNQQGDTTRTEVIATNADARNVNVSRPTRGGAAKCEAAATDDDGYTLTLEIPKGGAADYESLTTDDKDYTALSEISKGDAADYESLTTDDKDYTALSKISKGGAADYESLTTDDKGYIPMSKTPKGGASNLKSLTTDDEAYIPMSEITKDKNQLYDDISPA